MWRRSVRVPGRFYALVRFGTPREDVVVALCSKAHKFFSTTPVVCTKEDDQIGSTNANISPDQEQKAQVQRKKNLLQLIHGMKIELSTKKKVMENAKSRLLEDDEKGNQHSPELEEAASAVASSLPFDKQKTTSELLHLVKKHKEEMNAHRMADLSKIMASMKIRRKPMKPKAVSASSEIECDEDEDGNMAHINEINRIKRNLFSGERLQIFTPKSKGAHETDAVAIPTIWDLEFAKAITSTFSHLPQNGFEEMIQWTNEGKLWEFPINNETGLEDDGEFYEHIFLDKHLADFPKEGPIRHFMELVACGLSKNPYLSVKQKIEHIQWFRDYFKEKEQLLKEIEAHEKEALIQIENISK
ncbi:28S ribosomal protein S31, mitochondrial [Protobothrops mucrosquamatus]|uniref:28S ribosomal protein S31, mitochondrial n=1 Tax=Protobothrops mucrosquamatus TaxID=103944 RepID=UPI00077561F6|nr:28S ribosomal protein S31, mitochondrial [Protobothrops mucrosquamatus]